MDDDLAALRQQYNEGRTHEDPPKRELADLDAQQWHRAVEVRHRVEHGTLTEWPNAVELSDDEKRVLGQMGDIISRFRRV